MQPSLEGQRNPLAAYEELCRELGATPARVALAWLLRKPVVSTAIVGPTTSNELRSSLGAVSLQLDTDVVERLDEIWPAAKPRRHTHGRSASRRGPAATSRR